jgi:hypothetical protein
VDTYNFGLILLAVGSSILIGMVIAYFEPPPPKVARAETSRTHAVPPRWRSDRSHGPTTGRADVPWIEFLK